MHCIGNQCLTFAKNAAQKFYDKKNDVAKQIYAADISGTPVTFFAGNRH
jgi:hypothetical protein